VEEIDNKTLIHETLEDVNKIRESVGFPALEYMRPGKIGDSCKCPIANSLKEVYEAKGDRPEIEGEDVTLPTPYYEILADRQDLGWLSLDVDDFYGDKMVRAHMPSFNEFISRFDEGKIPKLIEEEDLTAR
jgi:hypothetical protein